MHIKKSISLHIGLIILKVVGFHCHHYLSMAQPCRKGEGLGNPNPHCASNLFGLDLQWRYCWCCRNQAQNQRSLLYFVLLFTRNLANIPNTSYIPVDRPDFCTCHGSKVIPSHLLRRNLVCLDQSHILLIRHESSDQIAGAYDPYICGTNDRLLKQEQQKTLQEQTYTQNHPRGQDCHGKFLHVWCPQLFMAGHGCETGIWMYKGWFVCPGQKH